MISEKSPKLSATESPQKEEAKKATKGTRGIVFCTDPAYHRKPWRLQYYYNGKRKREFFATKTEASTRQTEVKRSMRRHGQDALEYDRKAHDEYLRAKKLVGDIDLEDVALFYIKRIGRVSKEVVPNVGKAITRFIEAKTDLGRSPHHIDDLKKRLNAFKRKFGTRLLSNVTRNDIVDWIISLTKEDPQTKERVKLSPRSMKNVFGAVSNLYSYADGREWIESNPCRKIDPERDLPTVYKGKVHVFTIKQGHQFLRLIEREFPDLIHYFLVQYFAGIRHEESLRFQGEWVDTKQKRIVIPGWFIDGNHEKPKPGTKTRDDWVIDNIDPHFWQWLEKYPIEAGKINHPADKRWKKIKKAAKENGIFDKWERNYLRHSFATYNLSAYRDQTRTSLMLRHRSPQKLWDNYLAKLVPEKEGIEYFAIAPK